MEKKDFGFFAMGFGFSGLSTIWLLYLWYVVLPIENPLLWSILVSIIALFLIIVGYFKIK